MGIGGVQWNRPEARSCALLHVCVLSSASCIVLWWWCKKYRSQLGCYVEIRWSECSYALYQPPRPLFHR